MPNLENLGTARIKPEYQPHFKYTEGEKKAIEKKAKERRMLSKGKEKIVEGKTAKRGGTIVDFPKREKRELTPDEKEEIATGKFEEEQKEGEQLKGRQSEGAKGEDFKQKWKEYKEAEEKEFQEKAKGAREKLDAAYKDEKETAA